MADAEMDKYWDQLRKDFGELSPHLQEHFWATTRRNMDTCLRMDRPQAPLIQPRTDVAPGKRHIPG